MTKLPAIGESTELDAMAHVLAIVGAAVTGRFAVALVKAISCTVLVSVDVFSAYLVLFVFFFVLVAALEVVGALVAGLNALGTLAHGRLHRRHEVGSLHGLGGTVKLAISAGLLTAVLGLEGAFGANRHAARGRCGADAGSLADSG